MERASRRQHQTIIVSISSFSTSGCLWPVAASLKRFLLDTVVAFSASLTLPLDRAGWTATVFLLALEVECASLSFRRFEPCLRWQGFSLALFYLMVPTLAALVISYRHPRYAPRYLLLVTPPYYLLAAYPTQTGGLGGAAGEPQHGSRDPQ